MESGSTSAVSGAFSGLPEGASLLLGSNLYFITYKYNPSSPATLTGNDVALVKAASFIKDQSAPGPTTDGSLLLSTDAGDAASLNYISGAATGQDVLSVDSTLSPTKTPTALP